MPWFPFIAGTVALAWGVLLLVYRRRLIAQNSAVRDDIHGNLVRRFVYGPRMNLLLLSVGFIIIGAVLVTLGFVYVLSHAG